MSAVGTQYFESPQLIGYQIVLFQTLVTTISNKYSRF